MNEYLDFELRISGAPGAYTVTAVRSPQGGEPSEPFQLPVGQSDLTEILKTLEHARQADESSRGVRPAVTAESGLNPAQAARQFGEQAFSALISGKVLAHYRYSLEKANDQDKGLRVRLRCEVPKLAGLPWEFLYDADREVDDYLCLSAKTPLVRYLELTSPPKTVAMPPPLRILAMVADPYDQLDVATEKGNLEKAIGPLDEVEVSWVKGGWRDLQRALRRTRDPWHIFHFIGHGSFDPVAKQGSLVLVGEGGSSDVVGALKLGKLFVGHPTLRLAVLNSCLGARPSKTDLLSSVSAELVRRGIPAVVAMQYPISDEAAIEFSYTFYEAIADGLPVDAATTEARVNIWKRWGESIEWATPVLHMRAPDGQLFDVDRGLSVFARGLVPRELEARPSVPISLGMVGRLRGLFEKVKKYWIERVPKRSRSGLIVEPVKGLPTLLEKVKKYWIDGVLKRSLYRSIVMDLGVEVISETVKTSYTVVPERRGAGGQTLPRAPGATEVFEEVGESLLILGDPGSGKTIAMLSLARDLITKAETDPSIPVPVVLNLSSWGGAELAFDEWMVNELSGKYQIPREVGRFWVADNRIRPLLDGLDEVREPKRRESCVRAINSFIEASLVGVVVCSRYKEYVSLRNRLTLNAAIRLQPLSYDQISDFLAALGPELASLRVGLERDSALRIDARSPLMLNIMVAAYQGLSIEALGSETAEDAESRRKQILDAYIDRTLRRIVR